MDASPHDPNQERKASNMQNASINDYTSREGFQISSVTVHNAVGMERARMPADAGKISSGKLGLFDVEIS